MNHDYIENSGLIGRKSALSSITRWAPYNPMFYRTNNLTHTTRVSWLVEETLPTATDIMPNFNSELAILLSLVHDDPEIITGDIQRGRKSRMRDEELLRLKQEELEAINRLYSRWPHSIKSYNYKHILHIAHNKNCPESMLVSYLDKLDALCESWHELFAGNRGFWQGDQGHRPPSRGTDLNKLKQKYSTTSPLFRSDHILLSIFTPLNVDYILSIGKSHNKVSILQETGLKQYDEWKKITLIKGKEHGLSLLIEQREH